MKTIIFASLFLATVSSAFASVQTFHCNLDTCDSDLGEKGECPGKITKQELNFSIITGILPFGPKRAKLSIPADSYVREARILAEFSSFVPAGASRDARGTIYIMDAERGYEDRVYPFLFASKNGQGYFDFNYTFDNSGESRAALKLLISVDTHDYTYFNCK